MKIRAIKCNHLSPPMGALVPSRLSNGRALPPIGLHQQQPDPNIISTASATNPNTAPLGELQRKITVPGKHSTDTKQFKASSS